MILAKAFNSSRASLLTGEREHQRFVRARRARPETRTSFSPAPHLFSKETPLTAVKLRQSSAEGVIQDAGYCTKDENAPARRRSLSCLPGDFLLHDARPSDLEEPLARPLKIQEVGRFVRSNRRMSALKRRSFKAGPRSL